MTADEIVAFCRFARGRGFSCGVTGTLASVEAVRAADEGSSKFALRAALCSSKQEWDAFEKLYESFYAGAKRAEKPMVRRQTDARGSWVLTGRPGGTAAQLPDRDVAGAGVHARLKKMDFSIVPATDQAVLERLAERLLRRMSWRLSRRWKRGRERGRIDLRRTIHRSIARGGEPFDLRHKKRTREQARMVMLIDVSGSMSVYSLFFLRFAHAIGKHFRRAETFVFSTSLEEVTRLLRSRSLSEALKAMAGCAADWAGGTKIGESLAELTRHHARILSRDTIFLILSDGWDTGHPRRMSRELEFIRSRVRRVVWLNPLLGMEDFSPSTEAMANALPHIDVFAPAHSLESLLQVEKYLSHV